MTDISTTVYPRDKVRITAAYRAEQLGSYVAGTPETVEIELNDDAVPANSAERAAFILSLVNSLFRGDVRPVSVDVDPPLFHKGGEIR